jgi:hypothetical protein
VRLKEGVGGMTKINGKSLSNNKSVGSYKVKACQDRQIFLTSLAVYFTIVKGSFDRGR